MGRFIISLVVFLSFNLIAQPSYVCTNAGNKRVIEVIYLQQGQMVPCEVKYHKDSGSQILWSAGVQEGYCEQKAKEFTLKQQAMGWQCIETVDEQDLPIESVAKPAHVNKKWREIQATPVKKSVRSELEKMPEEELQEEIFKELEVES